MLRTTTKPTQPTTLDFLSFKKEITIEREEKCYQIKSNQLNKTWRTAALLQTTLDLKSLIRMFSSAVNDTVSHSGITYRHVQSHTDVSVGRCTKQSCSFQLLVEKQKLGEITFMSGKPFTQKQRAQLEFLLASLVFPLRNALQYLSANQASITDPLTGEYNRLIMTSILKHDIDFFHRYKTPLTMLIIDIDTFKNINDVYGRDCGDKVIQATADTIAGCIRETDTLVRYGGDEFILLLANTTLYGAYNFAELIRDVMENMQIINKGKSINFTISIGGASFTQSDTSNSLLTRADEALQQSKKDGGNCVSFPGHVIGSKK